MGSVFSSSLTVFRVQLTQFVIQLLILRACALYSFDSVKTEISLAVHRVGPTLLLDYLDVPALISYASQVGELSFLFYILLLN